MTDIGWICLAVVIGIIGLFGVCLIVLSGRSEQSSEAQRAATEADDVATVSAKMTAAQTNAAPDDTTLDTRLKAGTF
ncbi:hypothetical protein [Acetobacter fallax]|uniref:Uncharacterized protein n=1 Tax=Acetobacter fallax TaxID=1737473 RepID=A0ABX0KHC8_9PROT|nr:hypothetical protein [Acetobacter fallax]NHO33317.1 hypothetical protein [Acetobacter fallax]NHO36938.1 hypothetical protein [Acetobacter fallax]